MGMNVINDWVVTSVLIFLCTFYFYLTLVKLCQVSITSLLFQLRKRKIKEAKLLKVTQPVIGRYSIQIYI